MMTPEELNLLLQKGEGYKLEFKENVNADLPKELVAFANAAGGRIIIGISDDNVKKSIKVSNAILSKIQDYARHCDPPVDVEVETHVDYLVIHVKEGENKPYRCTKGFYLRNGANSAKLTTREIIQIVQEEGRTRFDDSLRTDVNFEENYDQALLNRFLKIANVSKSIDDTSILKNLSVVEVRESVPYFNNAGLLFFARNLTYHLYHASIVCALYKGIKKVTILDRKEFAEDLISNIEDTILFLKKHLNLRIEIEGLRHQEILEIPELALREAVVNAVCHRDYFEKGANVMVEIYDDRVEITNPGGLPKTLKPEDFGKKSVCRNSVIASLLLRSEYIEKMGTGISRIKEALKETNCPAPVFEFDTFFTMTFPRTVQEKTTQETKEEVSVETSVKTSVKTSEKIFSLLKANGNLTIPQLSDQIGVTTRSIERNLKGLQKTGRLKRIGPAKGGYWEAIE